MCNGHDFIEKGKPDLAALAATREVAEAAARGRAKQSIETERSSVVAVLEVPGNIVPHRVSPLLPRELRSGPSNVTQSAKPLVIIDVAAEPLESLKAPNGEADLIALLDRAWEAKTTEARTAITKLLAPALKVAASSTRKEIVTALEAQSGIAPKDIPAWLREADPIQVALAPVVVETSKGLPVANHSDRVVSSTTFVAAAIKPVVQSKSVEVPLSKAEKALHLLASLSGADITNPDTISPVVELRALLRLPPITHPDAEVLTRTLVGPKAANDLTIALAKLNISRSALPPILVAALERFETKKK